MAHPFFVCVSEKDEKKCWMGVQKKKRTHKRDAEKNARTHKKMNRVSKMPYFFFNLTLSLSSPSSHF